MADPSYQPKVYRKQGGDELVIASGGKETVESGGEIDIESGGALKIAGVAVTASAAELNKMDGVTATPAEINAAADDVPLSVTLAAASAGANVCEVTITVKDAAGVAIAEVFNLDVFLSDAATGAGLTGTSASGTVQAKSASGADLEVMSAKKAIRVQTLATGIYILEITDTAKTGFYVCAQVPGTGKIVVSAQLVTGDYGS